MRDETGYSIPAAIEGDWRRADKIGRELVAKLTTIIEDIEAHIRRKDLIVAEDSRCQRFTSGPYRVGEDHPLLSLYYLPRANAGEMHVL